MKKKSNRVIRKYSDGSLLVDISTGKFPETYMRIDSEDWDYLQSLNYGRIYAFKSYNVIYAMCSNKGERFWVHRLLLPTSEVEVIDHINHDGLDNRRKNIRRCTASQNAMNSRIPSNNTSGVKGLCKSKRTGKWIVQIKFGGIRKIIGYFENKEEAVLARKEAENKYFGEFAVR